MLLTVRVLISFLLQLSCSYIKGGVDAKELFHVYITIWIQDKRLALLDLCKLDRVTFLFIYFIVGSVQYLQSCAFIRNFGGES